jgi:uncharacterized membrane protein
LGYFVVSAVVLIIIIIIIVIMLADASLATRKRDVQLETQSADFQTT